MQTAQRASTRPWTAMNATRRHNPVLQFRMTRYRHSRASVSTISNAHALSISSIELRPNHDIYISNSNDPYFNLSLEDWLFRNSPESKPLLLIYRDSPCVVIGRNQNPWTEVNFPALYAANVPFVRRRSGGGTVYHDEGNTNFSIHLPRTSFDRHATGRLILRAVQSLGIDAYLNDRNDICVGPDKVSGSAYKLVNKRSYHHGTMLLTTKLDDLGIFLRTQTNNMVTKGVSSIRSPVCNLQRHSANANHDNFTAAVVSEFRKEYEVDSESRIVTEPEGNNVEFIRQGMQELKTWDWSFGQTPEFVHTLSRSFTWADMTIAIRSKHGLIIDVVLSASDVRLTAPALEELVQACQARYTGRRYGFLDDITPSVNSEPLQDIDSWLQISTRTV